VNGHVEVNVNVSWSRKDWVRRLLDRLKLANDPSHPCFDITSHGLEIDGHPWRAAHHDQPPGEKVDARNPPETMRFPAVNGAPESLTSNRVAADSVSSLAMGSSPWLG
jgi:hypothetical protein